MAGCATAVRGGLEAILEVVGAEGADTGLALPGSAIAVARAAEAVGARVALLAQQLGVTEAGRHSLRTAPHQQAATTSIVGAVVAIGAGTRVRGAGDGG